jgi:hypothetical protein
MPWRETSPMDLLLDFVRDWETELFTMTELAAQYGISRKTGYKWLDRYDAAGALGLLDQSRRPLHSPHATEPELIELLVAQRQRHPHYSNGILYTVTNWSIVAAVDARTGKEIWRYDPQADRSMTQPGRFRLCCGVNSRGLALYEGKVLVPVIDGRMQALDAATGRMLWSRWAIPEPKEGEISSYSITMAPRVAKGKVFIGNAGGEFPL